MNTQLLKVAWIRNSEAPVGQPALGRLNCRCGNAPLSRFSPENGDVVCNCGIIYTWDGFVKEICENKAVAMSHWLYSIDALDLSNSD